MDSPQRSSAYSTFQVIDLLRRANPDRAVSEARIRYALRSGHIHRPAQFGDNFAWTCGDIASLCEHLGLRMPEVTR